MKYNSTVFPIQKLPSKQKTTAWGEQCVDYIVGMGETVPSGQDRTQFEEMQTLYDLYNSIFKEKDLKYVTDPFKQEDGFPANPQNMNIIKPKVDLLLGEATKQPFNFRVLRTNQDGSSDVQDRMKNMLYDYSMAKIMSGMSEEAAIEFHSKLQSGEIMPPESIAKYMTQSYKDIVEESAYHTLAYLKEKLNLQHEFYKGFKDALIAGREVYYCGIQNGDPYVERVNPMYFSHDTSPDLEFIEDGDWACRRMRMSYTEIYDRLSDKMSEKDLDRMIEMTGQDPATGRFGADSPGGALDYNHYEFRNVSTMNGNNLLNSTQLNLWHSVWRSYKKVGFITYMDENGSIASDIVSEDYMKTGMEISIEWKWVIEVWEGYRIGEDLYVGIQPIEYQHVSVDKLNSQKLPYVGVVYNNTNSRPRSLVSIMKPLQYMYIIVWYRLELAMSRDKGKVVTMDITQIPKSMNIDPAKWMHYLSAVGVNFVNPYECFAPGTKVIMHDGRTKNIEDIHIGEYVMGDDGSPREVLSAHSGIDKMYRLSHRSGANDQIVNSKHKNYYFEKNYFENKFINKLATAEELIEEQSRLQYKAGIRYTKRATNVDTNWDREVKIDPYFLGLWLGDGSTGRVEITNIDKEVISWLDGYAASVGMNISVSSENKNSDVQQIRLFNRPGGTRNQIAEILKSYGIFYKKDIPDDFIYTSRENRLRLLAGLIDTDGNYSKRDCIYSFSQCEDRKHIVEKAAFIARSLGFKCTVNSYCETHEKYICNLDNISICQPTYSLSILDWDIEIPTNIERKIAPILNKRGDKDYSSFKISEEGIGEFYGIHVSGNNLFLLDDFTIVHNTGWDIPGREGGKSSQFNQITSLDLTMASVIDQYINLMAKIEDMVGEISGVSRQREGQISTSESVGNVQRSTTQSAYITEPLFWMHNQCKRNVITMMLNTAKEAFRTSGRTHLQYMFDDTNRAFIELSDKFLNEDVDIFVSDSTKESNNIEMLKSLYQPAMQNGASLLDIADIMASDNMSIIRTTLKDIEKKRAEQQQQSSDAENQRQMQLVQAQNEYKQQEIAIKQQELQLKKYQIDTDNQTKITLAEIETYKFQQELDADGNGVPDQIEIANLGIKRIEHDASIMDRQMAAAQKDSELRMKERLEQRKMSEQSKIDKEKASLERAKLDIEEKRMAHDEKMQRAKDAAAMAREKVKAKTAIKNKVVGQK